MDSLNAVLDDFKDKKLKYGSDMDISKMWIDQVLRAVIDDLRARRKLHNKHFNRYVSETKIFKKKEQKDYSSEMAGRRLFVCDELDYQIKELQAAMGRLS